MTLAEYVAALDLRLKDSANSLFSTSEKEAHLQAALQEYNRRCPRIFTAELSTTAGAQQYPLPAECRSLLRVVLPCSSVRDEGTSLHGWLAEAEQLWLFPVPVESGLPVRLTCAGDWLLETLPPEDTELVLLAAHARCCEALASDTARAFVFWSGNEKFDKSEVSRHYLELAAALRAEFRRRTAA